MRTKEARARLEQLRNALRSESISYGELAELQSLAPHIDPDDIELLEAAGVPEKPVREKLEATIQATQAAPVTIYYCKAGIATGRTVRVMQGKQVWETSGVTIAWAAGSMFHDNSKGKPKASGARCVLILTGGSITFPTY